MMSDPEDNFSQDGIAIIGMAARFPGARDIEGFWQNLRSGVESISFFTVEELEAAGVDPVLLRDPNYVRARAVLEDADMFDAAFFNFTPREAEITDPQHRLFMECAWEALENAGYDPERYEGSIGVYAGLSWNTYLLTNLLANKRLVQSMGMLQTSILNRVDHLSPKVSYHFDLRGPSVTVQTACSTSLVAVHFGCQSLLSYQCDMVIAGGVSVNAPLKSGSLYQEGSIISPDGHCRPFDASAHGTVGGNGIGLVVLKRLDEALADRDFVYAVIKGSAINNDGSVKAGYAAPGVYGQARVIATAQAAAGVLPDSVSYIEAHGTGTSLGDPAEIAALTQVFRASTERKQFCALGSVKSNIGHLDTAAGIAGLIKTVLALKHQAIPPSLHFVEPNPVIDFQNSPFYVNTHLRPWTSAEGTPRRAGVSSFGIGGTNAHVVLEEAPSQCCANHVVDPVASRFVAPAPSESAPSSAGSLTHQLLLLSARRPSALESATVNLARYLREHQELDLADVAYTLQIGRKIFARRRAIVCQDMSEAINALETLDPLRVFTGRQEIAEERSVIFMFPGQGAQHLHMAAEIYHSQPTFRATIDHCARLLAPKLGCDIRSVLYPVDDPEQTEWAAQQLQQTMLVQAALFVVEYALAQLWMEWGVRPSAMIGHSLGEYVAACLAGVFTLEDGLCLIATRGRLMQSLPTGAMLSVSLSEEQLRQRLTPELSLAAINGPTLCVASGTADAVARLERELTADGVACHRLSTSHAFHSAMMESIIERFVTRVRKVQLRPPQIPYVSTVTGRLITAAQATDPAYWGRQLRLPVRFATGVEQFFGEERWVFLEVGPGRTLMTLTRWHPAKTAGQMVLTTLPAESAGRSEQAHLLSSLGQMWSAGVGVQWDRFGNNHERRRVPLPSYPFERQRYWIEATSRAASDRQIEGAGKQPEVADWFYVPSWKRVGPVALKDAASTEALRWLIFVDEFGLGEGLKQRLEQQGDQVTTVSAGPRFQRLSNSAYQINVSEPEEYRRLFEHLLTGERKPDRIVHLWSMTAEVAIQDRPRVATSDEQLELSFYSLLYLAKAVGDQFEKEALQISVVSNEMQEVTGEERLCPEKATLLAPCRVIGREYAGVSCRSIDLMLARKGSPQESELVERLLEELKSETAEPVIALRGRYRWAQNYERVRLERTGNTSSRLREGGVYLITGGLGGVGLTLGEYLVSAVRCKLVLIGRSDFPERERWSNAEEGNYGVEIREKVARLKQLEAAGGEVEVIRADVSNEAQMRNVVERIKEKYGAIHGVIHAAGVPGGGMMQLRTHEASEEVLAPKVRGTRVLETVLKDFKLDFLVLCSSRSSILGGLGTVDYCAANLFLDAFARYLDARRNVFTVSINWPAWREVGMLFNAAARMRVKKNSQRPLPQRVEHPLLDQLVVNSPDHHTFVSQFSVATHWILDEHRIFGHAVVPGVTYLEMARAAFEQYSAGLSVQLEDVYFLTPLILSDDESSEIRLVLERSGDGFDFKILSHLMSTNGGSKKWQKHAIGRIRGLPAEPIKKHDLAQIMKRCQAEAEEALRDENLGPRWQVVKKVYLGKDELLAMIELPEEFTVDLDKLKLHPALMDRCAGLGRSYLAPNAPWLPLSYKRLRVKGPLTRRLYTYVRGMDDANPEPQTLTYDVLIMDENGVELVEIEGFSHKRIRDPRVGQKLLSRTVALSTETQDEDTEAADDAGLIEELEETRLRDGISPSEGTEVFRRILSSNVPTQVIVSPRDFQDVLQEVAIRPEATPELDEVHPSRSTYPRPEMPTAYVKPESDLELSLAEVWQDILGLEAIGIDDNFFELGGDSVQAIQIAAKAQKAGLQLGVQQLFQHPTIAGLAAEIDQRQAAETVQVAPVVVAPIAETALTGRDEDTIRQLLASEPGIEEVFRLSPLQHGLLFDSLRDPAAGLYVEHFSLDLYGALNVSAFVQAWQQLMDRHQMLRASFLWKNLDEPLQVIHRKLDAPLAMHDWTGLSETAQHDGLKTYINDIQSSGLELSQPPLLRLSLIQTAQDNYKFVCSYHHILLDGWSINILLSELYLCYQAARQRQEAQLDENRPYQDYILWLQAQNLTEAETFWRKTLRGFVSPTRLPGLRPHDSSTNAIPDFGKRQTILSGELTATLHELVRRNQLTFYTLIQGIWAIMLSHYSGEEDVVFGTIVSGRPTELMGAERIVGLLANALPVRIRVPAQASLVDWLQGLMEQHFEIQQYEYSPLVQVRGWSEISKGQPLFESLLTYENLPVGEFLDKRLSDVEVREPVRYATRTNYALSLVLEPRKGLLLNVVYDARRFEESAISQLLRDFEALCHCIAGQENLKLEELRKMLDDLDEAQKISELKRRTESRLERFKNVQLKPIDLVGGPQRKP